MGFRVTQLLHVTARLNLADHLAAAPQSAEQLATKTAADPLSLGRMKSVLHNWTDRDARRILECCDRAMTPGTRLLVAERIVPSDAGPSEAKLFDIDMLVVVGGRERTEAEYRRLLESSGFAVMRLHATQSPISILEAERN